MKNIVASIAAIVFVVSASVAFAVEREAQHVYEGETYFQNSGVTGNQQTGNASYVNFQMTDALNVPFTYYLWVDSAGKLRIASFPTISAYTSFPSGDWRLPNFNVGTVVGSQS